MVNDKHSETGFEIVSPTGVQRRADTMLKAFQALAAKGSELAKNELSAYRAWYNSISTLDKWFASGTLNELDEWKRRYEMSYNAMEPDIRGNAPAPASFFGSEIPWQKIAIGLGVVVLAGILIRFLR